MIAAVLWLIGAAVAWRWTAQPQVDAWRLALAWCAVAGAGAIVVWTGGRAPTGVLDWDGDAWTWTERAGTGALGRLRPALDLQHVILVRWRDARGGCWLWLERRRCGARWDDVRRAVYSRARPEALPPAEPPAATS